MIDEKTIILIALIPVSIFIVSVIAYNVIVEVRNKRACNPKNITDDLKGKPGELVYCLNCVFFNPIFCKTPIKAITKRNHDEQLVIVYELKPPGIKNKDNDCDSYREGNSFKKWYNRKNKNIGMDG